MKIRERFPHGSDKGMEKVITMKYTQGIFQNKTYSSGIKTLPGPHGR